MPNNSEIPNSSPIYLCGIAAVAGSVIRIRIASDVRRLRARSYIVYDVVTELSSVDLSLKNCISGSFSIKLFAYSCIFHRVEAVVDPVTELVDSLKSIAVVRLRVKAALEVHLLHIAAAVGKLAGDIPSCSLNTCVHVLDRRTCVAEALCELSGERMNACLILISKVTDSVVYTVETIHSSVVECVCRVGDTVGNAVKLADERLLIDSGSHVSLSSAGRTASGTACTESATAKAAESAVSVVAEQEKDDDPRPVVSEHTVVVTVVAASTSADVGGSHFGSCHKKALS